MPKYKKEIYRKINIKHQRLIIIILKLVVKEKEVMFNWSEMLGLIIRNNDTKLIKNNVKFDQVKKYYYLYNFYFYY